MNRLFALLICLFPLVCVAECAPPADLQVVLTKNGESLYIPGELKPLIPAPREKVRIIPPSNETPRLVQVTVGSFECAQEINRYSNALFVQVEMPAQLIIPEGRAEGTFAVPAAYEVADVVRFFESIECSTMDYLKTKQQEQQVREERWAREKAWAEKQATADGLEQCVQEKKLKWRKP